MSKIENNAVEAKDNYDKKSETNNSANGSKFSAFFAKNKNAVIIVAIVVFVFLLALVPILINEISEKNDNVVPDNPDTGTLLSGTYVSDLGVGSSKYVFDGNKVTNTYLVNGETTTIEYTYVIAIEGGVKVIKLTTKTDDGASETTTHEFEQGVFEVPCIWINGAMYLLSEN